jgi:hypothetical protein
MSWRVETWNKKSSNYPPFRDVHTGLSTEMWISFVAGLTKKPITLEEFPVPLVGGAQNAEEQCHMAKLIERYDADTIMLDRRHALELAAH